jgi:SAM-dependent methyltransferase
MAAAGLHPSAAIGFERSAAEYERGRPGYPPEAAAFIRTELRLGVDSKVVDLAAGTGKLTRALVESDSVVIAVEPLAAMRTQFARALPHTLILGGLAERLPMRNDSVDAIAVANAWHWFDSPRALSEAHRVLKPGGRLAVIYNRRDERVAWIARLTEIIDAHRADTPQYRSGKWHEVFETTALFEPLDQTDFVWEQPLTRATLRDRVASISFIADLDTRDRQRVLADVDELAAATFRDRSEFTMQHNTEVYLTTSRR